MKLLDISTVVFSQYNVSGNVYRLKTCISCWGGARMKSNTLYWTWTGHNHNRRNRCSAPPFIPSLVISRACQKWMPGSSLNKHARLSDHGLRQKNGKTSPTSLKTGTHHVVKAVVHPLGLLSSCRESVCAILRGRLGTQFLQERMDHKSSKPRTWI